MNNLNKLSNIWSIEEELAFRERDRELSKRLAVLRSEYLDALIKKGNPGPDVLDMKTRDASTQTDISQKSKRKFF
jgi:hypothetical protein